MDVGPTGGPCVLFPTEHGLRHGEPPRVKQSGPGFDDDSTIDSTHATCEICGQLLKKYGFFQWASERPWFLCLAQSGTLDVPGGGGGFCTKTGAGGSQNTSRNRGLAKLLLPWQVLGLRQYRCKEPR